MSNTKTPQKKSLSQVVDEIEDNKEKALKYILFFRLAKREGIELSIEQPIAYNFEREFADYIINTLADMYLNLKIPPKKKKHPVPDIIFPSIKPEIEKIYEAIKKNVGVSGSGKKQENKRKQAAINCFEDSKHFFKAIERDDLEYSYLYQFAERKGRRDFEKRILKKIIKRNFSDYKIICSEDALLKAYKKKSI